MKKGFFITLEGLDGSGKSIQSNLLAKKLQEMGFSVVLTREPGGTHVGEKIREILLQQKINTRVEALLFLASRVAHLQEVILPAFHQGKIVVSSRYIDSSVAYQGFGLGLGGEEILNLNQEFTDYFWPQLTIYIKIDLSTSILRRGKDKIEIRSDNYFTRVEEGYQWLINKYPERIVVVNGNKSLEDVHLTIVRRVLEFLNKNK